MGRKIFDTTVIIVFFWFSYVQLNDTDGTKWIIIYSMVAILGFLSLRRLLKPMYVLFAFTFLVGYTISNINLLTSWLDAGQPSFIDYEPTTIQEVENMREFLGLVICLITTFIYLLLTKKPKR
jgi:hypothetical protein